MNERAAPCRKFNGTSDLVECLQKADKAADFALNSISAELSKRLTGDDFERLKTTEALWRQYRETNCAAERALYEGGTGGPPAYLACREAMTRARIRELQVTYAIKLKN